MISKQQLRREIAELRRELDPDWIAATSARIAENLQQLDEFRRADTVALYMAIAGEVDLSNLFSSCWHQGKHTCIPIYSAMKKNYEMAEITANTSFQTGHYGIPEPQRFTHIGTDKIDLMIVPGVAFDLSGNRLGRGGGYYDRILRGFNGFSLAVAFDFQVHSRVPSDSHDIPVDMIVTETKTFKVKNEH